MIQPQVGLDQARLLPALLQALVALQRQVLLQLQDSLQVRVRLRHQAVVEVVQGQVQVEGQLERIP